LLGFLSEHFFVFSIGLNVHFATKTNGRSGSRSSPHPKFSRLGRRLGGGPEWKDIAKDALCDNDGDAQAVLDALMDYDMDVNWFVSVVTAGDEDASDNHKAHGKEYVKFGKCGYDMIVFEDKEPPTGICPTDDVQQIIDDAVAEGGDADDIADSIKDALDDEDLDYSFLVTYSDDTENTLVSILDDSCVVQNAQVYLYLYAED